MEFNVMTFNIHHGRGTDGKLSLERIAKVIEESKADLIGLNEVDRYFSKRSEYIDQVSWLAKHLKMNHAFGEAITLRSKDSTVHRQYGNAFLSRYPIVLEKNHFFTFNSRMAEGRSLLESHVQLCERLLKVYVVHLSLNPFIHKQQTDFIIEKVMNEPQSAVIMGDWNMRPGARAWKKMLRYFKDVCDAGKGMCYTFPSFRPRFQLDYIFVSRDICIASAEVIKKIPSSSDHLPLKATLQL